MDLIHKTTQMLNKPVPVPHKKVITAMRIAGLILLATVFSGAVYNTLARQFNWNLDQEKKVANRALDKTTDFGRIIIDDQGKIISWNKGMTDMLGWTSKEMRGGGIDRVIPPQEREAFLRASKLVEAPADPWPWDYLQLKSKNGDMLPVRIRVREVANKTGSGSSNFQFLTIDRIDPERILPGPTKSPDAGISIKSKNPQ